MAFESILLCLALYKTLAEARQSTVLSSNLMIVLLRDSVLYFGGFTLFTVVRLASCYTLHMDFLIVIPQANFLAWYIAPVSFRNTLAMLVSNLTSYLTSSFHYTGCLSGEHITYMTEAHSQTESQLSHWFPVHLGMSAAGMYCCPTRAVSHSRAFYS